MKKGRVAKTRGGGTMTSAMFFGKLRSALRRAFRYWPPIKQAKDAARRPNQSANPRLKWEFRCAECGGWFPDKQVEVHHKIPCGSLRSYDDLPGFVQRLTADSPSDYLVMCKKCHKDIHNND